MASIRERNGKFNVIYSYTNEKGERKQKWETYETKAEAKRRKKEIEYKKEMGSFVVRKCKTLDELITEYVALYGKENWALSTYEGNVSLALALLVTQKFRGATLLRGIFFMPNMIGGLLLGFTWQFIFISIFEAFSKKTGIAAFSGWLSNPETGFIGLLILTVWQMSGYMMIVYIAQIQQIPESVKEAARIDGANSWQLMRYIILPLMMPAFTIGLFLSISSSFKMFDQNLALTQGGPYKSTEMIALNIYNSAFGANEFGFAQAKAIVFLIIVAGIGVTQLVITKRKEVEM